MKQAAAVFILSYFFLGSFILPQGDFSVLPQLPKMYQHCKLTEDPDMNIFDFVTDHLLDFDSAFGIHETEENEKPHSPVPFQNQRHQSVFNHVRMIFSCSFTEIQNFIPAHFISVLIPDNFSRGIFHPPSL